MGGLGHIYNVRYINLNAIQNKKIAQNRTLGHLLIAKIKIKYLVFLGKSDVAHIDKLLYSLKKIYNGNYTAEGTTGIDLKVKCFMDVGRQFSYRCQGHIMVLQLTLIAIAGSVSLCTPCLH